MPKISSAEWLLTLFTTRERASAITGDLAEEGRVSFFNVLRMCLALFFRAVAAHPFRIALLALWTLPPTRPPDSHRSADSPRKLATRGILAGGSVHRPCHGYHHAVARRLGDCETRARQQFHSVPDPRYRWEAVAAAECSAWRTRLERRVLAARAHVQGRYPSRTVHPRHRPHNAITKDEPRTPRRGAIAHRQTPLQALRNPPSAGSLTPSNDARSTLNVKWSLAGRGRAQVNADSRPPGLLPSLRPAPPTGLSGIASGFVLVRRAGPGGPAQTRGLPHCTAHAGQKFGARASTTSPHPAKID